MENLSRGFDRLFSTYCYNQQLNRLDETCRRVGIEPSLLRHQDFESRALNARSRVASQIKEFGWSLRKVAEAEPRPFGTGAFWWHVLKRALYESELGRPWKVWAAAATGLATFFVKAPRDWRSLIFDWRSLIFAVGTSLGVFVIVNLPEFIVGMLSIPPKLANRGGRKDGH